MSSENDPDTPPEPEILDAVYDLAGTMEHHETRLQRLERTEPAPAQTPDEEAEHQQDRDSGDRRVKVRRRGPLRRRRRVAGRATSGSPPPAGWRSEDGASFAGWVEWLREHELHDHIPADWPQIPLIASELRALRWSWLSCERGTQPSFDWTHWHDALGRSLARIEEWKSTHQRHSGLSALSSTATQR